MSLLESAAAGFSSESDPGAASPSASAGCDTGVCGEDATTFSFSCELDFDFLLRVDRIALKKWESVG